MYLTLVLMHIRSDFIPYTQYGTRCTYLFYLFLLYAQENEKRCGSLGEESVAHSTEESKNDRNC